MAKINISLEVEISDTTDLNKLYLAENPTLKLKDNYIGEKGIDYKILKSEIINKNNLQKEQNKLILENDNLDFKFRNDNVVIVNNQTALEIRNDCEYAYKGFWLNQSLFDFSFERDSEGALVLVISPKF